jgi:hypothetical protein
MLGSLRRGCSQLDGILVSAARPYACIHEIDWTYKWQIASANNEPAFYRSASSRLLGYLIPRPLARIIAYDELV